MGSRRSENRSENRLKNKLLQWRDPDTRVFWSEVFHLSDIYNYFTPTVIVSVFSAIVSGVFKIIELILENGTGNYAGQIKLLETFMWFFIFITAILFLGFLGVAWFSFQGQIEKIAKGRFRYIRHIVQDYHYCQPNQGNRPFPEKHNENDKETPEMNPEVIENASISWKKKCYKYVLNNAMLHLIWINSFKDDVPTNLDDSKRGKAKERLSLMRQIIDTSLDSPENTPLLIGCSSKAHVTSYLSPSRYRTFLRELNDRLFDGAKSYFIYCAIPDNRNNGGANPDNNGIRKAMQGGRLSG